MKKFLLLFFCLLNNLLVAQMVFLKQEIKRDLVQSIPQPFSLMGEKFREYSVSSNNGTVEQIDSTCKYTLTPEKIGTAKITVRNKSGKLILEENYKVKAVEFFVRINGFKNSIDNLERFTQSANLALTSNDLTSLDLDWKSNFELVIAGENNRKIIQSKSENGNLNEVRKYLLQLTKGDIVIFRNIKVLLQDNMFDVPDVVLQVE